VSEQSWKGELEAAESTIAALRESLAESQTSNARLCNHAEALIAAMERMDDDKQTVYAEYVDSLRAECASLPPGSPTESKT
jgi:uncharacterized coiled-coil protein SlyX